MNLLLHLILMEKKIVDGLISNHCDQGGMVIFATHQAIEIDGHDVKHIHLGASH